jgi:hypothetical protein
VLSGKFLHSFDNEGEIAESKNTFDKSNSLKQTTKFRGRHFYQNASNKIVLSWESFYNFPHFSLVSG